MSTQYCLDRIALQDLMLDYAAGIDERDFERYSACFAEDVEVHNFGDQTYHGREAWLGYVLPAMKKYASSQHLLGPQLAKITGDSASTRSDVQALHVLAEDSTKHITLWATYLTEMKKLDGAWKISRHELVVRAIRPE